MDDLALSDLNLVYACTMEKTVMIETQAREITNQDYIAALHLAHAEATKLIPPQLSLAAKVAVQKRPLPILTVPPEILSKVRSLAQSPIEAVMSNSAFGKFERGQTLGKIEEEVKTLLILEGDEISTKLLPYAFDAVKKEVLRRNIFERGVRVDGRSLHQVRELQCEAGTYPALHGSSLFSRGNTQVLCTVTMGAPDDAQRLDSLVGIDRKRFMVHYSFPPFSINEVGRTGGLNRREVGHGTLAEKALVALLPPEEDFPYSVRVTSECLASDGSSSMATVCGGSLALMDAGIPLRSHVGAVSVGLVSVSDSETGRVTDYRILTDILGLEDHLGDMDFKIAGTRTGITAIQLDIKPAGVPLHILCEALEPALVGRIQILDFMEQVISSPRDSSRENLPRSGTMNIQQDSIGRLIGPQGSNVKNIQVPYQTM
jgi:polyribonucleotide nucleotidyltransferase